MSYAAQFQPSSLLLLVALMVVYEAVRTLQWVLLLRALDPSPPWRMSAMAYLGGELVKGFPAGQYAQTILLRRAGGTPIAHSLAATSLILWIEATVCLVAVGVLGTMSWPWLQPVAWGLVVSIGAVGWAMRRGADPRRGTMDASSRGRLQALRHWGEGVIATARVLLRPRSAGLAAAFSAVHVGIAGLVLWVITCALGVQSIAIYAFALAANLLILLPFDLGLIETAGAAGLMAYGVPNASAVAIMLMHRAVCGVLTAGLTATGLAVLRPQVQAALHGYGRDEIRADMTSGRRKDNGGAV
jgi:uncharacterized membrane protein YbhN (UPF0104 family)